MNRRRRRRAMRRSGWSTGSHRLPLWLVGLFLLIAAIIGLARVLP